MIYKWTVKLFEWSVNFELNVNEWNKIDFNLIDIFKFEYLSISYDGKIEKNVSNAKNMNEFMISVEKNVLVWKKLLTDSCSY